MHRASKLVEQLAGSGSQSSAGGSVEDVSGGPYMIRVVESDRLIGVDGTGVVKGIYPPNDSKFDRWELRAVRDGLYSVKNVGSGKVMAESASGDVIQKQSGGGIDEQFYLRSVDAGRVTVQNSLSDRNHCDYGNDMCVIDSTFIVPHNGKLVEWHYFARVAADLYGCVWRKVDGTASEFQLVGENKFPAVTQTNSVYNFPVAAPNQIAVQEGDYVGLRWKGHSSIPSYIKGEMSATHKVHCIEGVSQIESGSNLTFTYEDTRDYAYGFTIGRDDLEGLRGVFSFETGQSGLALTTARDDSGKLSVEAYTQSPRQQFSIDLWVDRPAVQAPLRDGRYSIQAVSTGLTLFAPDSNDRSQWQEKRGTGGNCREQLFDVASNSDGYYTVKNVMSGKVMDVLRYSDRSGAKVMQYGPHGGRNQQFALVDAGAGTFSMMARHSGKFVALAESGLVQEPAEKAERFRFCLDTPLEEGRYMIRVKASGLAVEDLALDLAPARRDSAAQLFDLKKFPDGYYTMDSVRRGRVVEVERASDGVGSGERYAHKFALEESGDGALAMRTRLTGKFFAVGADGPVLQTDPEPFTFTLAADLPDELKPKSSL